MNKIFTKYSSMSAPVKASLWFVFCSVLQRGISMLTTPIFTRILTQEEYGTISVYNSWLGIITIIVTLELATGVFNKAMIKYKDDRDGYASSTLFLSSCVTVAFFVVYIVGYEYWNSLFELSTVFMVMMFTDIFFTEAMLFWTVRKRFEFEYKSVVAITLISNVLASALSVVFVLVSSNYRAELKVLGIVVVHVVVYGLVYLKILKKGKKLIQPQYWKYAVTYNLPLIPHYLSQTILNQSDRIMISRITNMGDAAVYTVAYQIAVLMNILTNAIHASFAPWAYQCISEKKYKKIGEMTLTILIVMSIMCFLFSLFAPEIILILGGKAYFKAVWIVPPVAMSIVFNMLYSLIGNFAFYYEKTKFVMFGTLTAAVINIILNAIFIPMFGFVAAGYTTLVCYILYSMLHYFFMLRICKAEGIQQPFNGKAIWGVALVSVLLSVLASSLYNYTVIRYVVVLVTMVALYVKRSVIIRILNLKKKED